MLNRAIQTTENNDMAAGRAVAAGHDHAPT
jgi:hypothetical protein